MGLNYVGRSYQAIQRIQSEVKKLARKISNSGRNLLVYVEINYRAC
jgi:hypothetical protein